MSEEKRDAIMSEEKREKNAFLLIRDIAEIADQVAKRIGELEASLEKGLLPATPTPDEEVEEKESDRTCEYAMMLRGIIDRLGLVDEKVADILERLEV